MSSHRSRRRRPPDGARDQPGRPREALLRAHRADDHPPDRLRRVLDVPDAERHLSGSGVPADRGHRPVAGPRRQGRRGGRHPADRGGGEHRPRGHPGALEVGARCRRALDRLRARHRHDPGAQRRPRPHGRSRGPAAGRHHLDHRTPNAIGLPDHLVRRHRRPRPGVAARLCLLRPEAADQPHPRRLVRHGPGRGHPRDPGRGRPPGARRRRALDRRRRRPAGQRAPPQGRRPARSRSAAVPGAGRHAGHRSAGPRGPASSPARTASRFACATWAGWSSRTKTARWRFARTARMPSR